MFKNSVDGMDAPKRVHCLDFLRGFFVFLALWQHFGYYLNFWYVDYFGGWNYWENLLDFHKPFLGKQLSVDSVSTWAAWFFTPWVSQVYLFLAAFNLAKRNPKETRLETKRKLSIFVVLFFVFTIENFIVAPNIGEAFSLYPLQTWMLILATILFAYTLAGDKAIWVLVVLGLVRFLLPLEVAYYHIQGFVQQVLHPNFEIDAKPDYFLTSAALGFLLGRSWWQGKYQQLKYWCAGGVVLWLSWLIFGEPFSVLASDVFATEHDLAQSFLGSLGIHGIELMIVSGFLILVTKNIDINLSLFNWIGRYSLLVFLIHRVLFLSLIMPIRMLIASIFEYPLQGTFVELWIYVLLIVAIAWMIKKSRVLMVLEGK